MALVQIVENFWAELGTSPRDAYYSYMGHARPGDLGPELAKLDEYVPNWSIAANELSFADWGKWVWNPDDFADKLLHVGDLADFVGYTLGAPYAEVADEFTPYVDAENFKCDIALSNGYVFLDQGLTVMVDWDTV